MRLSAIDAALQAIRARPVFGWGLLSDASVLSGIIGQPNYVDNSYLSFAVDTGIVGAGAFVLLATSILGATRHGWNSALGLALSIAVAAVLAMSAFASVFQVTQGYAAFFVLAALAVVAARQPLDPRNGLILEPQPPTPPPQGVADVPGKRVNSQP
jgi:O-antigen ligase